MTETAKVFRIDACAPIRHRILSPLLILNEDCHFFNVPAVGSERQSPVGNGVSQVLENVRQRGGGLFLIV